MHPENHPIKDAPLASLEERVRWLELHVAMLWDQVWWMNLPEERRKGYEAEGFKDPIQKFYGVPDLVETKRGR